MQIPKLPFALIDLRPIGAVVHRQLCGGEPQLLRLRPGLPAGPGPRPPQRGRPQ